MVRAPRLALALAASLATAALAGGARAADPAAGGAACPAGAAPAPASVPADPAAAALERGNALLAAGHPAEALAAYDESERSARDSGHGELAARAAASAARAAAEGGDRGAPARLAAAEAAVGALPGAGTRTHLEIHLARSWSEWAARGGGAAASARAAALLESAAARAAASGDARDESYALGYLGELREHEGKPEEALDLTRRALMAGLAADAPDALYRWHWQAARLHSAAGRSDAALASYRQAAALAADLRTQTALSASAPLDAGTLYLELVDLLLRRAAESQDPAQTQQLLSEALQALESQKADELRDYFHDECLAAQRKASPDEIPGAVIVYPISLPDRLEIVIGGSGPLERHAVPVTPSQLDAQVHQFRYTLARRTTREYLRPAETLYDWLIRPIEPALAARKPDAVVFVPGGSLRTVPFAALHDARTRQFLIERYPVAMLPGLSLTDPRPLQRGRIRLLAAGISVAVEGYPALASVDQEIRAVEEAFPGEVLVNQKFQVDHFVDQIESRPFGIVHVASHAEFSDDPSKSFLLAFDGRISMDRLSEVVSATQYRAEQPLELLTLSACETAAGNDRAALGLAGIALRAGARSALATLWSVNDEAASQLIVDFYGQLREPGVSRARALQAAQLELLRGTDYRHPAYWSPFVLISSWL